MFFGDIQQIRYLFNQFSSGVLINFVLEITPPPPCVRPCPEPTLFPPQAKSALQTPVKGDFNDAQRSVARSGEDGISP